MASTLKAEWIQVRLDLSANPKVSRMVDLLSKTLGSYVLAVSTDDLFSGTRPVTCPVTSLVTRHALTDVIVGGLIRTWGAANAFIKQVIVPHARLDWVDDQSKIPGFGKAMAKVGWVIELPEGGLEFPNFDEWNRPKSNDLRSNDAVRKERQRLRKWLAENPADHPDRAEKVAALSRIESRDMSRDSHDTKERKEQERPLQETPPPAQERARAAGFPSSEEQARSIAINVGVDPDYAATVWHEIEGRGGSDDRGQRVTNFGSHVKARWNHKKSREAGIRPTRPAADGVESVLPRNAAYAQWKQARAACAEIRKQSFHNDAERQSAATKLHALERQISDLETAYDFTP